MKRGEVFWVNFDPSIGGEIQKTRPAVIISNDVSNAYYEPRASRPAYQQRQPFVCNRSPRHTQRRFAQSPRRPNYNGQQNSHLQHDWQVVASRHEKSRANGKESARFLVLMTKRA